VKDQGDQHSGNSLMPLYFAVILAVGIALGKYWNLTSQSTPFSSQSKIEQVMELVEDQYVDTLESSEIEERAINRFLASFDPHSVYIPSTDVAEANQDLKGSFQGVGIEFFIHNDTPYVARVFDDGPADKAGILPSDRILSADGKQLIGLENKEIISFLKGKKESVVDVEIWRPALRKKLAVPIQRGQVQLKNVHASLLDDSTIYFRVAHFANTTMDQFTEGLKKYQSEHELTRVVMDLRNNPGGYLQVAVELLDEFIDSEELLAYTLGKGTNKKSYHATPGGMCKDMKLICLVNAFSASASEIFSGAIQDLDRGLVIGHSTYGKGLVQETFHLDDASQIRLTVSRYYIPSGRSIQKPYGENGYTGDSSVLTKKFTTKRGRTVQSSGGITPDIPQSEIEPKGRQDYRNQHILFVDQHFKLIQSLGNIQSFWSSKEINEALELIPDFTDNDRKALKAELAYQFYGDDAWIFEPERNEYLIQISSYFEQYDSLLNP